MTGAAWLLPVLPFAAAVAGLLFGRRLRGGPAGVAILGSAAAAVVSVLLFAATLGDPSRVRQSAAVLTPAGGLRIYVGTRVDGLAAVVAVMVCVVALCVQVYSTAYLHGDAHYSPYAAEVSLFTSAMLLVVVSADLFQLLVGWEVMGICSYLLIGHYWEHDWASGAAVKAFVTTRVGDVGFLLGIVVLATGAGSSRIDDVLRAAPAQPHHTIVVATLLLVCGVAGKSAQFPLHTWLPDAMAGPTPISALIHAATMVAAGVYVVARLYPLFLLSPVTLDALGVLAAITMVLGACAALAQDDLKRVLAYSTVSQLAYMLGALAVGGYAAGIFHLLTHAAFKALLFLGAGAVIHSVATNSMSEMGGLRRRMPVTFLTTTVGLAALAGLPPFAGFFSKDAVLGAAYDAVRGRGRDVGAVAGRPLAGALGAGGDRWMAWTVLVAGLVTVLVTGAYVARAWLRTFFGSYRGQAAVHEAPAAMTGPLVLLAVPAAVLGFAGLSASAGPVAWLGRPAGVPALGPVAPGAGTGWLSLALSLAGVLAVTAAWRRSPAQDPARLLAAPVRRAFDSGFYLDDLYRVLFLRPLQPLAEAAWAIDRRGVDGAVRGAGGIATLAGAGIRRLQNGNVQRYATALFVGSVLLAVSLAALA